VFLFSESHQDFSWINTRCQYENDGHIRQRIFENVSETSGVAGDEISVSTHAKLDEVSDSIGHSVWSEASEDNHLLEQVLALGLPFTGQLCVFRHWLVTAEPVLPLFEVQADSGGQASEGVRQQTFKLSHIVPSLICKPVERRFDNALAVKHGTTTKEEVVLCSVDLTFRELKFDEHLQGEEQLMALEQGSASLVVNIELVVFNDSIITVLALSVLALINRLLE
jgi:hypothetical protein